MAKLRERKFRNKRVSFQNKKRKTVSMRIRESESFLAVFAVLIISVISFSYILQTNSIATKGYEVEEYEQKLEELQNDFKNMKAAEAELRSMKQLDEEKSKLSAVSSADINFIDLSDTSVAMR
jgi:uncharacterized membrane protein (DUF106 family)